MWIFWNNGGSCVWGYNCDLSCECIGVEIWWYVDYFFLFFWDFGVVVGFC